MSKALIKQRKKRKPVTPTIATLNRPKGREARAGHEERLPSFIKRTLQLKRDGYYLHEIAEKIAEEFKLVSVPHITTIANWRKQGTGAVTQDIIELQSQMRIDEFNELDKLKAKWMPIAIAQGLEITRWVRVEGELQPELDENAVEEQLEATKAVLAIMSRQAKLLGLDLDKAVTPTGDGPASLMELQLWIINQANDPNPEKNITPEVLELASGLPEGDAV